MTAENFDDCTRPCDLLAPDAHVQVKKCKACADALALKGQNCEKGKVLRESYENFRMRLIATIQEQQRSMAEAEKEAKFAPSMHQLNRLKRNSDKIQEKLALQETQIKYFENEIAKNDKGQSKVKRR